MIDGPGRRPLVVRPCGPAAALVEVGDARTAATLADWLRTALPEAVDLVPAAASVLVDGVDADPVERVLAGWDGSPGSEDGAPEVVEVGVVYDGEDLGEVAGLWSCSVEEVVRRHVAVEWVSAFCGFAPGFAYLDGLPAEWAVPRRSSPRARVPAGSVALADRWCGTYPTESPGGWLLLGRTEAPLWDVDRDPPALLPPGTPVRFRALPGGVLP